jgi:hypothetical protein
MYYRFIMAGVLGRLIGPQKKAMYRDPKAVELETAKEILAEVFRVRLSEVLACRGEAIFELAPIVSVWYIA